jgi:hypothetical protein
MRDLYIYHPGTGTCISLADPVYLLDAERLAGRDLQALDDGTLDKFAASVIGTRIDNTNMTHLFFGKDHANV